MKRREFVLYQGRDIRGRVRTTGVVWVSDRGLPRRVWGWERWVDGMESVLVEWVRHSNRATVKGDDGNALKRDNLGRRDSIASPIPIGCSEVLGRGFPTSFVNLVFLGNCQSMALHHLLYNSINNVVMQVLEKWD